MKKICALLCGLALLLSAEGALAVGGDTTISQNVIGADTSAPSIPANVQAVAISASQITVTWDPSTDNVGVDGYQIFRDGFQIATTSLTYYADTGLTAATTYGYTLRAFDAAGNISSSSATSTATTDAIVVPPSTATSTSPQQGSIRPAQIRDLVVDPHQYSADISWNTTIPTQSIISWGTTRDYELASLEERSLQEDHATRLTELRPGTRYYFRITSRDRYNRQVILAESSFVTESLPDTEAPVNVSNLTASAEGNDVVLSWRNPGNEDFSHVRIVRRIDGFPVDPYDGVVVYEGAAEGFRDTDAFASSDRVQYAVFAYDRSGNAASGALVRAQKAGSVAPPTEPVEGIPVIEFRDLIFIQAGKEVPYIGNEVKVNGKEPLEIRILYERLPEHLKTIVITLQSPLKPDSTFSFLLRVNADKSAYTAVLAPFGDLGEYPLSVSVLDYSQKTITELKGSLLVQKETEVSPEGKRGLVWLMTKFSPMDSISWIVFFLLVLIILIILSYRNSKKEVKQE